MRTMLCLFSAFMISAACLHGSNISWSTSPTAISGSNINASDPHVAIDSNGNAVAVWVENNLIKASSKAVNGSWTSEVTISATSASSPCVVSDSNGNASAIWLESGIVKASTKSFGGSWSSSIALSSSGSSSPSLCVDGSGDFIAAWARTGNVETSTKLYGNSWQPHTTIFSASAGSPRVAVGGSGSNTRAVIVWQGTSSNINVIYASTKLISGSWSGQQVISEMDHNAVQPFVAVDSNANVLAIWYAYDIIGNSYANVVVKSAGRRSSTGNWSSVSDLSSPGIRNPSTLKATLAFDKIGNAIALWNTSFDDQTFNLESAIKPVNENWSSSLDLIQSSLYTYSLDLSVTTFGDVLALYMFYNGNTLQIQSVESDINGYLNNFWSVPITISLGTDSAYPKIAASLTGNLIHAVAIWEAYNGSYTSILTSTGSKSLVLAPTNLSIAQSQQNFGVFTQYVNTLTWTASTDANAVGYLIFRNGLFIAQVGADATQYVDNNRTQNGSVTYGVTAIDKQETQSATVKAIFP